MLIEQEIRFDINGTEPDRVGPVALQIQRPNVG
jgi:hypothetical protein